MKNISEIKILKFRTYSTEETQNEINKMLKNGWILLDISTYSPDEVSGSYSHDNYFTYHLGKLRKEPKEYV